MSSYLHGAGGPSGVGIEVEFLFVILLVVLPAIVLPLVVWLPCIVVCASADILPKFIDATTPATNIPTAKTSYKKYNCWKTPYSHSC